MKYEIKNRWTDEVLFTCEVPEGMESGMMRIGCQNHSIEDWKSFTDEQISQMASDALEFWNQHKAMLLGVCDSYKHTEEN